MGRPLSPEAQALRDAWKLTRRDKTAVRYVDHMLERCEYVGDWFYEVFDETALAAQQFVPPLPARQRNTGVYRANLREHMRLYGVPPWFKPNSSRRARIRLWTSTGPERYIRYDAHHFSIYSRRFHVVRTLALVMYLPEGEQVSAVHRRDMHHFITGEEPCES